MTIKIRPDGLYEIIIPPGSKLDYGFDWTNVVTPESVSTSVWTISPTVTLSGETLSGNTSSIYVEGAVNGKVYYLTNQISTPTITDSRTIVLVCQPKGAC